MPRFVRTDSTRHSKLGKKRKKLQKWRRAKGRDNKIRQKRHGYPVSPTVGHRSSKKESGKIKGLIPILVHNTKDLERVDDRSIAILAKVGANKKLSIIKKATEMKINIANLVKEAKK